VRRNDFTSDPSPETLEIDGRTINVSRADGICQIIDLRPIR